MAFYEALNEYNYDKKQLDNAIYKDPNGSFQLAQSPTKRLICMKNSSIEHYKHIRERNLVDRSGEKQNMIYMASPERSYVVKTNEKINYNLAFKKNPSKFYEEALNAPITKHKIQQQRLSLSPKNGGENRYEKKSTLGSQSSHSMSHKNLKTSHILSTAKKSRRDHEAYTIVSKQTTRPHNRINQKIKTKIEQKLADQLGSHLTQKVLKALEDANLQDMINDIISQDSSQLNHNDVNGQNCIGIHSKAMSVKSLQIQNQLLEDNIMMKDDISQKSNNNSNRNMQIASHHIHQRKGSNLSQNKSQKSQRSNNNVNHIDNYYNNDNQYQEYSNQKIIYQDGQGGNNHTASGQISHRSGTSSKFYHSENNAFVEEEVKINKAY